MLQHLEIQLRPIKTVFGRVVLGLQLVQLQLHRIELGLTDVSRRQQALLSLQVRFRLFEFGSSSDKIGLLAGDFGLFRLNPGGLRGPACLRLKQAALQVLRIKLQQQRWRYRRVGVRIAPGDHLAFFIGQRHHAGRNLCANLDSALGLNLARGADELDQFARLDLLDADNRRFSGRRRPLFHHEAGRRTHYRENHDENNQNAYLSHTHALPKYRSTGSQTPKAAFGAASCP